LKKLVRDGSRFYLRPLNPQYPMLGPQEGDVFCGVVREKDNAVFLRRYTMKRYLLLLALIAAPTFAAQDTTISDVRILLAQNSVGRCTAACSQELGICQGSCQGNGQCIAACSASHGRCVANCR
jgi:hypothetical protein